MLLEFVGDAVATKTRFAAQQARSAVERYCGDAHLVVRANGRAELEENCTEDALSEGLAKSGGSHQGGVVWRFGHYGVIRQAEDRKAHRAEAEEAEADAEEAEAEAAGGGGGEEEPAEEGEGTAADPATTETE